MTPETFLNGRVTLHAGDSRDVLKRIPDCSIDSIVTDPPYALVSIVKRFANSPRSERTENTENPYGRTGRGFMGQKWDTGETAFAVDFWAECLRVLKPGGHVVASSSTRTVHRMVCAIEDAGFEIRDSLQWLYGSGFPKSHDVAKGLGKQLAGPSLCEEWQGWGTALKPAVEPICLARKPLDRNNTVAANVLQHGTGAINIDACRIHGDDAQGGEYTVKRLKPGATLDKTGGNWRPEDGGIEFHGNMKPGRWPANIIHDGSDEVLGAFPETTSGTFAADHSDGGKASGILGAMTGRERDRDFIGSTGSAARFFYTAKADADDRLGSKHPTVKPVDLMQWLCRLVTPPGGTVLDPFAGTGTTGEAAFREGFNAILIERETEYQADIRRRMSLCMSGPDERKRESIKAKLGDVPFEHGSLFAGIEAAE
jgi:site-specific DNA-methyltransferase (adenine-specific)